MSYEEVQEAARPSTGRFAATTSTTATHELSESLGVLSGGPQNLEEVAASAASGEETELDGLQAAPESSPADATPHRALLDSGLSPGL